VIRWTGGSRRCAPRELPHCDQPATTPAVLRRESSADARHRSDPLWPPRVKYSFVTAGHSPGFVDPQCRWLGTCWCNEYVRVDDAVVVTRLADLSDLGAYISAISAWLATAEREDVRDL
jgi:hypothetical protein